MEIDNSTKIILALIAVCLVLICVRQYVLSRGGEARVAGFTASPFVTLDCADERG